MSAEMRLKERGIVLSEPQSPSGNYLPFRLHANTLYLSGQDRAWPTAACAPASSARA